jgi:chromosomal replication initiator protein
MNDIEKHVCDHYNVSLETIRSKSRLRVHTEPRFIIMYMIYSSTTKSFQEIAKQYNRHHSTVIYACETIDNLLKYDKEFKHNYRLIESKINPGIWIKELEQIEQL